MCIAKFESRDDTHHILTDVLRISRDARWKFRQGEGDLREEW